MLQELYDVTYVCNSMHSVHELGLPVMHCTISACCGCSVTISIYCALNYIRIYIWFISYLQFQL